MHEQVRSTAMGSLISGLIAEAVMQRLDSLVFDTIDRNSGLGMWTTLSSFGECLNAVLLEISFTMEEEENNQLAFLDVLVCHKDGGGLNIMCSGKQPALCKS
ncbi:unnamed protein product [Dibothriocephalus latus]|uniref:Uncharacterized protein n=1 Tax=Dibothriocephalus latus TaxID=60516 RepID=A0A3P7LPI9_DIBLA|nr:unnamed protein product [Dibothriocephalus latus]